MPNIEKILQNSIVLITSTGVDEKSKENTSFGTGFVFWKDNQDSYILTCAHVLEEVGEKTVRVGSIEQVEVIACGARDKIDLAVLKVIDLSEQTLLLCNLEGQKHISFQLSGFYKEGTKIPTIGKNVEGTTASQITLTRDKLDGWSLEINEGDQLQKGYSGSPIVDKETGKVFAVATHEKDSGSGGYAISIRHLLKIWDRAPSALREILNSNTKKRQNLTDTDCQVLIEFSKAKENFYTVGAWLAYPPQEFENIYVKDEPINLHDEAVSTQLTVDLLKALDEVQVNHDRVTLEFILPIDLYFHPVEQWKNEDGNPIGAFYPIAIRSQERLHRQELKRFWKSIQPDLDKQLSNKVFWLDKPQAKLLYLKSKDHLCFALQFDLCQVERNFLFDMLKYGIAVGLWSRCCQDFPVMQQQVSELLNNRVLADLPIALKEFRATQWAEEQYTYHLTLFWDDRDTVPPPYQLKIPT